MRLDLQVSWIHIKFKLILSLFHYLTSDWIWRVGVSVYILTHAFNQHQNLFINKRENFLDMNYLLLVMFGVVYRREREIFNNNIYY